MIQAGKITLLLSAEAAVPRLSGSTESRVSMSAKAERGTSLNVSATRRLFKLSSLEGTYLCCSGHDRLSRKQFCNDATNAPHINRHSICCRPEQKLWSPIPQSYYSAS
nr:hypothetical protein Iba_chr08cCG1780 [Ipomoea batatas]